MSCRCFSWRKTLCSGQATPSRPTPRRLGGSWSGGATPTTHRGTSVTTRSASFDLAPWAVEGGRNHGDGSTRRARDGAGARLCGHRSGARRRVLDRARGRAFGRRGGHVARIVTTRRLDADGVVIAAESSAGHDSEDMPKGIAAESPRACATRASPLRGPGCRVPFTPLLANLSHDDRPRRQVVSAPRAKAPELARESTLAGAPTTAPSLQTRSTCFGDLLPCSQCPCCRSAAGARWRLSVTPS